MITPFPCLQNICFHGLPMNQNQKIQPSSPIHLELSLPSEHLFWKTYLREFQKALIENLKSNRSWEVMLEGKSRSVELQFAADCKSAARDDNKNDAFFISGDLYSNFLQYTSFWKDSCPGAYQSILAFFRRSSFSDCQLAGAFQKLTDLEYCPF